MVKVVYMFWGGSGVEWGGETAFLHLLAFKTGVTVSVHEKTNR